MASHRRRNDGKSERKWSPSGPGAGATPTFRKPPSPTPESDWLWGWHTVLAALNNPNRDAPRRLLATPDRAAMIEAQVVPCPALEIADAQSIARVLPQGAAHQGVALKASPLESAKLEDLATPAAGVLLMLDQLTDPQNVGAIFRSAAAFGAVGVIVQDRHAPAFTGALAKAAAGALDALPHVRVVNLSRALDQLSDLGWRAVGLDGEADRNLDEVLDGGPTVLVMGSEGEGLRRLVAEHCDVLARIPMPGGFESLNVSAAAAVALYAAAIAGKSG